MPADRMFHPRQGHSAKVSQLTHLEYRVWVQSLLSADDFGVLRLSAVTLQADNDALSAESQKALEKALKRIADVGLLLAFEHQGRMYACHPAWQEHQRIEYPRETIQPKPSAELLANCSEPTRKLFTLWPKPPRRTRAGRAADVQTTEPEPSPNGVRTDSEPSPNESQTVSNLARAQPRETATATAKATAEGFGEAVRPPTLVARQNPRIVNPGAAVECWDFTFRDLKNLAAPKWPDELERYDRLLDWLARVDEVLRASGTIPKQSGKEFWPARFRAEFGSEPKAVVKACRHRHTPPCPDDATCTRKYLDDTQSAGVA